MLEVEIKAKINRDLIKEKLSKLNLHPIKKEKQVDTYFHHPCRDFKLRDEALRVREIQGELYLAYKGPKVDPDTKSREEIQVEVGKEIFSLLKSLGFIAFEKIIKEREIYKWQGLKICIDQVEMLGSFIEIEGRNINEKEKIFNILNKLGVSSNSLIRKSYLELKLEKLSLGKRWKNE